MDNYPEENATGVMPLNEPPLTAVNEPAPVTEENKETPNVEAKVLPMRQDNKFLVVVILLLIILIALVLGFSVIFFYQLQKENLPLIKNPDVSATPSMILESPTPTSLEIENVEFSVELPRDNDLINGEIKIHLRYLGELDAVMVTVHDSDNNLLAEQETELEVATSEAQLKQVSVDVTSSPQVSQGYITLIPISKEQELTALQQKVDVRFLSLESGDRLKVYAPLLRQVIFKANGELVIAGEMQGFFEGVLNYRLLSSNGISIKQGVINASEDNYGAFVAFSEEITLSTFPDGVSDNGRLELYEISMEDGGEKVLLSIPLRFK